MLQFRPTRLHQILFQILQPVALHIKPLDLDVLAFFDGSLNLSLKFACDEHTGHVSPVRFIDVFFHGFDALHFDFQGLFSSDDFFCESHFLSFHVLSDVGFTFSKGFFDTLEDSFLDAVVFLSDNCYHLTVKEFEFVVQIVNFITNFLSKTFQSLISFNSSRLKTRTIGDQVLNQSGSSR